MLSMVLPFLSHWWPKWRFRVVRDAQGQGIYCHFHLYSQSPSIWNCWSLGFYPALQTLWRNWLVDGDLDWFLMTMLLSAACINKIMHYFAYHFKLKSPLYINIPVLVSQCIWFRFFGTVQKTQATNARFWLNLAKTKRKKMTKNKGKHERKCFLLALS